MKKPKFKILSIDGGGIRGIIPCTILAFIESQVGSLSQTFHLMAGTSTGGIIALGLTMPDEEGDNAFYASDMLDLYMEHGTTIFGQRRRSLFNKLIGTLKTPSKGKIKEVLNQLDKLSQQPYISANLEELLYEKFGTTRLDSALTDLLITTYGIEQGKAFYFLSRLAKEQADEENFSYQEIARSTSAAPTYFEPSIVGWQAEQELAFIDGGVFANNPSVLAYSEAKELWKRLGKKVFSDSLASANILPDDDDFPFFMLSLGTGYTKKPIPVKATERWKSVHWMEPLLTDIFMRSVAESTHFTMQHLLPNYSDGTPRYCRFDIEIPEAHSHMDDGSKANTEALHQIAQEFIDQNKEALLRVCELLD